MAVSGNEKREAVREMITMRDEILQILDDASHPATELMTMLEVFARLIIKRFPVGVRQSKVRMLAEHLGGLIDVYESGSRQ